MKILFVSVNSNPLDPPINGDTQRTRLLYEACTRIADVDVITFAGQKQPKFHQGKLGKWLAVLPFTGITSLFPVDLEREAVIDAAIKKNQYDYIVSRYF